MGNTASSHATTRTTGATTSSSNATSAAAVPTSSDSNSNTNNNNKFKSFPGSAVLEKTFCGSIDTTDPSEYEDVGTLGRLLKRAEVLCISSPIHGTGGFEDPQDVFDDDDEDAENSILAGGPRHNKNNQRHKQTRSAGQLLARALVSEVTDNPQTMTADRLQERERMLLRAQHAAALDPARPAVGREPPPHVLRSLRRACTGDERDVVTDLVCPATNHERNSNDNDNPEWDPAAAPYQVTIGLCLSRRSAVGHPGTVTRQTAYDFNDVQDREGKYVSSCAGWNAGGGESGGSGGGIGNHNEGDATNAATTTANVDTVHIPIIHIDCRSQSMVDAVIGALASGEVFIPHMAILPEALASETTAQGTTNVTVRFGCERRDEVPPEEWSNWQLEFMHNQLYEFFQNTGARWMKRPFQVVLAESVRWKTVKHMNRYFAQGETVVTQWRDRGPQFLDPVSTTQVESPNAGAAGAATIGGTAGPPASKDECLRPHGIYLFQRQTTNGGSNNNRNSVPVPTNYFAPNFEPPYTTKMTRNLLLNVLCKSWDSHNREWASSPVPHVVTPTALLAAACGCTDRGGFVAQEVTNTATTTNTPTASRWTDHHPSPPLLSTTTSTKMSKQQQHARSSPHHGRSSHHSRSRNGNHQATTETSDTPKSLDAAGGSVREHSAMEFPSGNSVKTAPATFETSPEETAVAASSLSPTEQQSQHHLHTLLLAKDSDVTTGSGSQKENVQDFGGDDATTAPQRQRYATAEEDLLRYTQKKGIRSGGSGGVGSGSGSSLVDANSTAGSRRNHPTNHHHASWNASVAGTETTVMHANRRAINNNSSNNTTVKATNGGTLRSPIHRGKVLYSDEDFLADLSDTETDTKPALPTSSSSSSSCKVDAPLDADGNENQKLLKQRRQNDVQQQQQHAVEMSRSNSGGHSPTKMIAHSTSSSSGFSGGKMMRANYSLHHHQSGYNNNTSPRNNGNNMKGVRHSESLDYSTDGSSAYFRTNDSTSLLGQDFSSLAPTVAPVVKTRPSSLQEVETEDDSLLSVQESTSSLQSVVPTDEELYAVGWAKALDPNSGNYYYFTLDRTRTVWENPMPQSQWGGDHLLVAGTKTTKTTTMVTTAVDP